MTTPQPETLEREKDKLYVTDAELYRRMGLPYSVAKPLVDQLTAKAGFPRKHQLVGGRRFWPEVQAWLFKYHGLNPQDGTPLIPPRGSVPRGGRAP